MAENARPIKFSDYLPEVFRTDDAGLLTDFLKAFEKLFEELEGAIEGVPGGGIQLTYQSAVGVIVTVDSFSVGAVGFPKGAAITVLGKSAHTKLAGQLVPNNDLTSIEVQDASFIDNLSTGDVLNIHPGGIPDLFNPDTILPPQFEHSPQSELDYLEYLADWIALPLRAEKSAEWNRRFFQTAITLYPLRSTLPGMQELLRAWLKGDLLETDPPLLVLTDLTRSHTEVDTVFQLGETATLGVNTVLGEGPPFFFIADLVTDPNVGELHSPVGIDIFQRAARSLLDTEKPAYTYYQLRVRAHTMQLAPPNDLGEAYAQVGVTTMLWEEPLIYNSC